MNCKKAREILNLLTDGEEHARAQEARGHVSQCAACREWHATMQRTLRFMDALPDVPMERDIAAAVMARLPERHPASVAKRESRWFSKRALVWAGAGWLIGVMVLTVAGLGLSSLFNEDSLSRAVVHGYGSVHAAGSLFESILARVGTLVTAIDSVLGALVLAAASLRSVIISLFISEVAVLVVIVLVWRRRRAAAHAHLTLV